MAARRTAYDASSSAPGPLDVPSGAWSVVSISPASAATVVWSRMSDGRSGIPNSSSRPASTSMALSEEPPSTRKSSWSPMEPTGTPSARAQMRSTTASTSGRARGADDGDPPRGPGGEAVTESSPFPGGEAATGSSPFPGREAATESSPFPGWDPVRAAGDVPAPHHPRGRPPRDLRMPPLSKRSRSTPRLTFPLVVRGNARTGSASTRTSSCPSAPRTRPPTASRSSGVTAERGGAGARKTTTRSPPPCGSVEPTTATWHRPSPGVPAATSSRSAAWNVRPSTNTTSLDRPVTQSRPSLRKPWSPVRSHPRRTRPPSPPERGGTHGPPAAPGPRCCPPDGPRRPRPPRR